MCGVEWVSQCGLYIAYVWCRMGLTKAVYTLSVCCVCPQSMTAQLGDNAMMDSFKELNKLQASESLQFGKTMFCSSGNLLIFARNAPGFESFVVVANLGPKTAHKFAGEACAGGQKEGEVVFHSHKEEHQDAKLKLEEAVTIGQNEVIVIKLPA